MDNKMMGGMFIGLILGLHFHADLVTYMPIFMIFAVIMVLRLLHR